MLREGRIKIHGLDFRERLMQQLREVHGKPTSGGGMSIVHPRWSTGGHGDLAAAFVLALWQASGDAVSVPDPEMGTEAHAAWMREKRQARMAERAKQPWWRKAG